MIKRTVSLINRLKHLAGSERGSFTLESAVVMPLLLLLVLSFILLGVYAYQKIILYDTAAMTAERAAFGWDNSHREAATGIAPAGSYDSLYWRVGDDGMLESVFGLKSESAPYSLTIPSSDANKAQPEDNASLALRKLGQASQWLEDMQPLFQGQAFYNRGIMHREVQVKLLLPVTMPILETMLGKQEPEAAASANVVDPVEFIRSVDIARYYGTKWSKGLFTKKDAGAVLAAYTGKRQEAPAS
ncbi:TadE/TadG family type IV pilus assembly protein [Paenibacillus protaetiae]|uniref:TadE-like domain-containing protein n=1 Tax=Paenibacillus protaetiae TaxID=2509456 RepID=A0A4P6F153_9BACL|nr:TadE/TadG family type IV pilus assembly protein [Paenibacillus protaetiae]QAY66747.1 hypothetical protein ET464_10335 [Paenibacillus protaetiae]